MIDDERKALRRFAEDVADDESFPSSIAATETIIRLCKHYLSVVEENKNLSRTIAGWTRNA